MTTATAAVTSSNSSPSSSLYQSQPTLSLCFAAVFSYLIPAQAPLCMHGRKHFWWKPHPFNYLFTSCQVEYNNYASRCSDTRDTVKLTVFKIIIIWYTIIWVMTVHCTPLRLSRNTLLYDNVYTHREPNLQWLLFTIIMVVIFEIPTPETLPEDKVLVIIENPTTSHHIDVMWHCQRLWSYS